MSDPSWYLVCRLLSRSDGCFCACLFDVFVCASVIVCARALRACVRACVYICVCNADDQCVSMCIHIFAILGVVNVRRRRQTMVER